MTRPYGSLAFADTHRAQQLVEFSQNVEHTKARNPRLVIMKVDPRPTTHTTCLHTRFANASRLTDVRDFPFPQKGG